LKNEETALQWNTVVHDLAWPVTVLCIAFGLRIDNVVGRLSRIKYGDAELEFLSKEANDSLAKAAHGGYAGNINIRAIFESVRLNEWATLAISRMLMRKGVIAIVGSHDVGQTPSLERLLLLCKERKLIPVVLADDLERLREVTFFVEWWGGRVPSKAEWKWALQNCERVVEALFDQQSVV
jgi:hypothetical protein